MFARLLEQIAIALESARIRYMVIGGQAVLRYGEARLTKDVDITLGMDMDRLGDLLAVVGRLGLSPLADPETFTRQSMVLPCLEPTSGIRIDFILSYSTYELGALGRAQPVAMGAAQVMFVSLEDLIIHKIIAGRPRDLEDVRILLLKNAQVDVSMIEGWLEDFSRALGEPFVKRFHELDRSGP